MPKIEAKQLIVNEIKDKVKDAKSITLVDARGLTVEQETSLRKKLRDSGVYYKVYKNTMINFAIQGTAFEGLTPYLEGPTAIAVSYDDPTLATRVISKEFKAMPKLEFKAGVFENVVYNAEGVMTISQIPTKEELLSKLLGSLKSPISAFARVINSVAEQKA